MIFNVLVMLVGIRVLGSESVRRVEDMGFLKIADCHDRILNASQISLGDFNSKPWECSTLGLGALKP